MGRRQIKYIEPQFTEESHSYAYQGRRVAGFTEIATAEGLINFNGIPSFALERAKIVGKAVHAATQYHDQKCLNYDSIEPEIKPYLDAYIDFCKSVNFKPILIEKPLMNTDYGYACTPDRVGYIGNSLALIELKKSLIYPWHPIQIEAQSLCLNPEPTVKYLIQLRPNGKWKPFKCEATHYHRSIWLSAVSLFHFKTREDKNLWNHQ